MNKRACDRIQVQLVYTCTSHLGLNNGSIVREKASVQHEFGPATTKATECKVRNGENSEQSNAGLVIRTDGISLFARHDLARPNAARRDMHIGNPGAVLAPTDRSAAAARGKLRASINALALVAKHAVDRAALEPSRAKRELGLGALDLFVMRDRVVRALLSSGAGTVARGRWGRLLVVGLAALGVRVPARAGRARRWGRVRVVRDAAALAGVPVPRAGAVVAAGRERRGRVAAVREAARAVAPPELIALAVVAVRRGVLRGLARVGVGAPDRVAGTGRLVVGWGVARAAEAALVPVPEVGALVARRRVAAVAWATDRETHAALLVPVKLAEVAPGVVAAKVKGSGGGSSADEDGSSRGNSGETHGWLNEGFLGN